MLENPHFIWLLLVALMVLLLVFTEVGFHLGKRTGPKADDRDVSAFGVAQAAILGMLALLLGFSFSLGASRYEARKQLVIRESNSIGTTYLRAAFLPPETRDAVRAKLRDYLQERLRFFEGGAETEASVAKRSTELQIEIWRSTVEAMNANPGFGVNLFTQSLNETIDLSSEEVEERENHVPHSVVLLIVITAMICALMLGYSFGEAGHRNPFASGAFSILVTVVVFTVWDFDQPTQGLVQVSNRAMRALESTLLSHSAEQHP